DGRARRLAHVPAGLERPEQVRTHLERWRAAESPPWAPLRRAAFAVACVTAWYLSRCGPTWLAALGTAALFGLAFVGLRSIARESFLPPQLRSSALLGIGFVVTSALVGWALRAGWRP